MRALLLFAVLLNSVSASSETIIERLTWAGVKLVREDTTVFIDAVGRDIWNGNPPGELVPVSADTTRRYALITHAHNDHFDVETLHAVLGERGYVIVPESEATYVASRGLRVIPAPMWQPIARGGFLFTAVPAVDGMGDKQVSWVVTVDNKRFFHGGDTLWHGQWSVLGQQFGPFDIAFLPINGARVLQEPMPESPITMVPIQAIDAGRALRASTIVPIHYGLDDPPYYTEVEHAGQLFLEAAAGAGVQVQVMNPGERLLR